MRLRTELFPSKRPVPTDFHSQLVALLKLAQELPLCHISAQRGTPLANYLMHHVQTCKAQIQYVCVRGVCPRSLERKHKATGLL